MGDLKKRKRVPSVRSMISGLEARPWRSGAYSRQSWGNWLHKMAPYAGRIKPAFAHWLIRYCSNEGDTILDPFCGIGTIPLEANLLNRGSVGIDLNPYAYTITRAKMDRRPIGAHLKWLERLELDMDDADLDKIPDDIRMYYNRDTLKEIIALRQELKRTRRHFLLGCLIGIAQGHRVGHLSKPCAWTIPFKPRPDDPGEYREVVPRLIEKVKRTYRDGIPMQPVGKIFRRDSRDMPLEDDSIDVVISSPPYFDTVDYVNINRLRLGVLGHYKSDKKRLEKGLIHNSRLYLGDMGRVCREIRRVLKPGGRCILVLGDWHKGNKVVNTAREIKDILDRVGFKTHGIVDDVIPYSKSVQRTPRRHKKETRDRYDRILLATNKK